MEKEKIANNERCCSNCVHQLKLFKHPDNEHEFKGHISEETGLFACTILHQMNKNNEAVIFETPFGECEMHEFRE